MSFPAYPEYKDSGLEWLGEVPEHWQVKRLKFIANVQTGVAKGKDNEGKDTVEVPYLRVANVQDGYFSLDDVSTIAIPRGDLPRYSLRPGDVLMNEGGDFDKLGRGHVWQGEIEPCIHQNHVFAVRPSKVPSYWLNAFTGSQAAQFYFIGRSKQSTNLASISSSNVMELPVVVPPDDELLVVLAFLDYETARIDALIEEQQRLIELLKEKRQAVISQAVTKGLDTRVPMKDSGVEWLGEVPAHWDVVSLKRVVVFQRGHDLPSDSREEGNVPVISSGGYSGTHSVACAKAPGIVTGRYGSIGQFTLATEDYWPLNTALYSIELYGNKPRYVWYLLQGYVEHFLLNSLKSAVPGVDRNDVHVVKVVAAPVEEQDQIVNYIDRISNQLDQLVDAAERNVTLLQERRSALISAAVTGKIDVRGWRPSASAQAPEPAVAEAV